MRSETREETNKKQHHTTTAKRNNTRAKKIWKENGNQNGSLTLWKNLLSKINVQWQKLRHFKIAPGNRNNDERKRSTLDAFLRKTRQKVCYKWGIGYGEEEECKKETLSWEFQFQRRSDEIWFSNGRKSTTQTWKIMLWAHINAVFMRENWLAWALLSTTACASHK